MTPDYAIQVFDQLSTAVLMFDAELQLKCINNAGEDLLSVSRRRVAGHSPEDIWPNSPIFNSAIRRTLDSGSRCIERGVDLVLSNNQMIKVDCMITPIFDGESASEVVVELVDANELVRVIREENLQTVNEAAKESVRGIAHEVKNPLGGIRGAAQLLGKELKDSDLIEYTNIIISEADRLRNFIDRMMAPNLKTELTCINIHEVIEYVINLIEAETRGGISIKRDYDPSLPDMLFDREQMIQALLNLLRNALQAIQEEGKIVIRTRVLRKITIQHKIHKIVLNLEVIDDGPGIPPEIENGAFYPMITGRAEGTGLGLPIAQQLIQQHGGIIEYERKNDKTCFRILLPMESNHE